MAPPAGPNVQTYTPHGPCRRLLTSDRPELLISGPAGTGKSLACLWKLHWACLEFPGARCIMLRKTRASLTDSALVTFEQKVIHSDDPILAGARRENRHHYTYPNGSEIVLGGMDRASRIMSAEYDLAYLQEAVEFAEDEWETVTSRLRHGRLPYQQILADTNPDRPTHWVKRRCDSGRTLLLESRHQDNPLLWDGADWTDQGRLYLARLDALTGPRYHRLRHGRWVQAEGLVYDQWDAAVHLIDRFSIPNTWPRYLSVDFGYTNPFVAQWWCEDDDGRLYRYREIYHTQRLVEDHARAIARLCEGEPLPLVVVCDHDAEDRATLERHLDCITTPATKTVSAGIQAVAARLKRAGDGRPRLFFLRDSLVERDASLADRKLPCCTEEEADGYIWRLTGGRKQGDEPVKKDDHGLDAARYLVATMDLAEPAGESDRGGVTVLWG